MTYILTVSSLGQITIPRKVRQAMGLVGGSKIRLYLEQRNGIPVLIFEPIVS